MGLTLDEVKQYLRVDSSDDDALLESLMATAKQLCGHILRVDDDSSALLLSDEVHGILVEKSTVNETEKFALLFEFDGDEKAIRHVLYNCSTSRPSIESETKEESISPGTEKLTLTADPREDGLVKSRTGDTTQDATYQNWYQSVYVPVPKTEAGASGNG